MIAEDVGTPSRSRDMKCPSAASCSPSEIRRAQGTPDAGRTREPCVQEKCTLRTQETTGQPKQPAFPAQWFTAYRALSPGHRAFWPPSSAGRLTDLIPASGDQDHTPSPSAANAIRLWHRTSIASRTQRLATMAKRPSEERGTGAVIRLFRDFCQAEILEK